MVLWKKTGAFGPKTFVVKKNLLYCELVGNINKRAKKTRVALKKGKRGFKKTLPKFLIINTGGGLFFLPEKNTPFKGKKKKK